MTIRNSILLYKFCKWAILVLFILIVIRSGLTIRTPLSSSTVVALLITGTVGYIVTLLILPLLIKLLLVNSKYPVILSKCFEHLSIRYRSKFTSESNYNLEKFLRENGLNKHIDIHTFRDVYYLKFSDNGLSFKNQSLQWNNIVSWKYKRILAGKSYADQIDILYKNESGEVKKLSLNSYEMRIYSYELLIMMVAYTS